MAPETSKQRGRLGLLVTASLVFAVVLALVSAALYFRRAPTALDPSTKDVAHYSPQFLPDGRHFLYSGLSFQGTHVYAGSLDSKSTTQLMTTTETRPNSPAIYASSGHLLFIRNGTLMAQPLDANRLALAGEPTPVAENVGAFAASENQVLLYQNALPLRTARLCGSTAMANNKTKSPHPRTSFLARSCHRTAINSRS